MHLKNYDNLTCITEIEYTQKSIEKSQSLISDLRTKASKQFIADKEDYSQIQIEQQINEEKTYIILQNQLREAIASKLNPYYLNSLEFKNKDHDMQVHHVFRWILHIFYRRRPSSYDWHSFKKYCLNKESANDMKLRIGLRNIVRMTKIEYECTKILLEVKQQILIDINTYSVQIKEQFTLLFDIMEFVIKTFEAGQRVQLFQQILINKQKDSKLNKQYFLQN